MRIFHRMIEVCAAGLSNFEVKETEQSMTNVHTPTEFFALRQTTLSCARLLNRMRKKLLGYDDVRDHFENLACLLDDLMSRSDIGAASVRRCLLMQPK